MPCAVMPHACGFRSFLTELVADGDARTTRPLHRRNPPADETSVPLLGPALMLSLPSPADPAAAPMQARSESAASAAPAPGLSVIAASEPSLQDVSSGAHRDGRIRNPVPSKLKGKTDGSKGNFSVMHMGVAGRSEATDRDAEAKRTSESTELAAKRAFENGYVSLRRSRFVHVPDEPVSKPFVPAQQTAPVPASGHRRSPLDPQETKSEQARLLTLLRSLHPVLVVDQICKALAFFGGIPGAPPPADGGFPESAEANGSGSLFVGWIAEIFPKLGGNSSQQGLDPTRQLDNPQVLKRKRGRPKGSKGTKVRKDKGIKKGPTKASSSVDRRELSDAQHEGRADVDGTSLAVTGDANANVMLPSQAADPQAPRETEHSSMVSGAPTEGPRASDKTASQGALTNNSATTGGAPSTRRRGRPKGSKNRPKVLVSKPTEAVGETTQIGTQYPGDAGVPSRTPQIVEGSVAHQSFTAVNSATPAPAVKAGVSERTGIKEQVSEQHAQPISGFEQPGATRVPGPAGDTVSSRVQAPNYQAPETSHVPQTEAYALPTPPTAALAQTRAAKSATQKRKRKGGLDTDAHQPDLPVSGEDDQSTLSPNTDSRVFPTPPTSSTQPPSGLAPEPPPKRQRKGKEPRVVAKKGPEATIEASTAHRGASSAPAGFQSPKSAPSSTLESGQARPTAVSLEPESALSSVPVAETPVPPVNSLQQNHFEAQSPTMENYEAQLQAQMEQQPGVEPQTLSSQRRPDSTSLMTTHLPTHQDYTQQRHRNHQHHHQQQIQQQQHAALGQGRSPNLQPQAANHQPASNRLITQQAMSSQNHFDKYRATTSSYQQQQQQQEQQQTYVSSQSEQPRSQTQHQHQQQLSGNQHSQVAQIPPTRQYTTSVPQPHQFASNPQPYHAGQQQLASQQRYQHHLTTTSAGTVSYTTHQPPQFGSSPSGSFNAAGSAANYRGPAASLASTSYGQRGQSMTPSSATFRTTGTHGLPQHSPNFGATASALQQRSSISSQPTTQAMQGLAGVHTFTGSTTTEWGLFDTAHLDASGQHGPMGLGNANYTLNTAGVRAPSTTASAFAATGLATFDNPGLGNGDRYYGLGRR